MSAMSPLPVPRFVPVPDLGEGFTTQTLRVADILASWSGSVFAFEGLHPDGRVKQRAEMAPKLRLECDGIEKNIAAGTPLPQPVLGVGMLNCVEIGAGRAVILTLAQAGVTELPVHIPVKDTAFFDTLCAPKHRRERGNIFVYILLAVILLATLSMAVMRTSRFGSAEALTANQAKTIAAELMTYSNQVREAVARLRLRGCSETDLNFENSVVAGYTNGSAPVDDTCDLFSPAGGNLSWITPDTNISANPWLITSRAVVHNSYGVNSTLANAHADLIIALIGVSSAVCTALNNNLQVGGVPVDEDEFSNTTKFTGTYTASFDINGVNAAAQPSPCIAGPASPHLCGAKAGCFREGAGSQRYIFYQVILDR